MNDKLPINPLNICLVLKTRRAARAITKRYNVLLAPYDIQSTQASLLLAISQGNFSSISDLAEVMATERSALTRNIQLLRQRGLIASEGAKQGKAQKVELSEEGLAFVKIITPLWFQAQEGVLEELGQKDWDKVQDALAVLGKL